MQSAIIVLLICCFLPLIASWISGYFRHQQFGVVDNKQPRAQSAQLQGAGARAVAAQANAWEALIIYSATLLALTISAVPVSAYATLVWFFVACRVMHLIAYVANQDIIRSLSFVAGYGCCVYMLILAL